jgi:hypothetical protein
MSSNRTGAAGSDRMRIRHATTYDALLSLAHLGRAALVAADQRQQRALYPYGPSHIPTAPPTTPRSASPATASVARRKARRRPPGPAVTTAGTLVRVNPVRQALDGRKRASTNGPPSWATS